MCGIIGSNFHKLLIVEKALNEIRSRGPDQTGIIELNNFTIGANRLSIQDILYSNQPLCLDSTYMVYNGEVWNNSIEDYKSDGYWILDRYKKYGVECFKDIDGMFALCIYDNGTIILARDYIGEIPIYYYNDNDKFCFASELKSFKYFEIDLSKVKLLQPGSNLKFKDGIIDIHTWYNLPNKEILDNKEDIIKKFRSILETAVEKRIPKEVDFTTLLSGGIDSTIIAFLLKEYKSDLEAYTIHLNDDRSSKRTNDLYYAREVSKWLGIKLNEIIISEKEVLDNIEKTIIIIEDGIWTQVASGLAHILMAKNINKKFKVVFSGGGSDEIFASYPSQKRWQWSDDQYDGARRHLITNLHKNNIIRENKCLLSESFEVRSPFLDREFVEYAINIPIKYRYENKRMKPILRYAFPEIPEHILWREKVCQGEGVGIDPIIKGKKEYIKEFFRNTYYGGRRCVKERELE